MSRSVRTLAGLGLLLGLLTSVAPLSGQGTADKVTINQINYADLGKFIRSNTGKVIVVDFWANF